MVYCDIEGAEHDWVMPNTMVKTPGHTEHIQTDSEDYYIDLPDVYYDGTETAKVHCQGTYIRAYGDRLKEAGLQLNNFSNTSCEYIRLPNNDILNNIKHGLASEFWMNLEQDGNKVPYASWDWENSYFTKNLSIWFEKKSLLPVIQINKNLIQATSN